MLGIGLPLGLHETVAQSNPSDDLTIDLDPSLLESNNLLKKKLNYTDFNVKEQTQNLLEVANFSQARKREKE